MHIEPDRIGREDVYQPGGGDGREAQVGRDDGHHGGQDVQRGGLGCRSHGWEEGEGKEDCWSVLERGRSGMMLIATLGPILTSQLS